MNNSVTIEQGTCFAIFSYDIGAGIDLDLADKQIVSTKERLRIQRTRAEPEYFDYRPLPLRVTQEVPPISIGQWTTSSKVEVVLYDFGAVSVHFRIPLQGPFSRFQSLSEALFENALLLKGAQDLVQHITATFSNAIEKYHISPFVEDYTIWHFEKFTPNLSPQELQQTYAQEMAQLLRSEHETLSLEEVQDSNSSHISFGVQDLTVIDWNGAVIFGTEMADVLAVLEFANVQLLERRYLDQQLDDALDEAYETLTRKAGAKSFWPGFYKTDLRRIAQLQVDGAILFERVTNSLKLLGDQYLARVYRMTSKRFHLEGWDSSILRKLNTIENIYEKLSDQTGNQRMEVLEWIIIILIAVSILLPFVPGFPGY
ncbi:hypothetical protein [Candidatus Nitronereus thalassa]|uniref:DUF155 domain-containing protein n=1 Tax=Candidatus Nitronereus thalassa TaxID=3020898 RepID=A0ABU3K453_9BACT|nr:hypothetical protein [Candidatus Nitronereus thalassa]MDT7041150.1 hypothetical protein [Candidatus Nitronereus thalassa]